VNDGICSVLMKWYAARCIEWSIHLCILSVTLTAYQNKKVITYNIRTSFGFRYRFLGSSSLQTWRTATSLALAPSPTIQPSYETDFRLIKIKFRTDTYLFLEHKFSDSVNKIVSDHYPCMSANCWIEFNQVALQSPEVVVLRGRMDVYDANGGIWATVPSWPAIPD
jgi:hypothetical protein